MRNVRNTDKDGYTKLRDLHRDALCRISQRIDFIAQLPYDLACMIANYFQLESLDEHIKVSRTWRERLLQYPTIWRRWSIFNAFPDTDNNIHLLPKITAYIQELTVDYCKINLFLITLSTFLDQLNFQFYVN